MLNLLRSYRMKKEMIILLLALFLSTGAFASQFDSLSIQQNLTKQEDGQFGFTHSGMVPLHKDKRIITFYVNPITQWGKESDPLTISCNNGVFKIHAGQAGVCHVSEKIGYFGLTKEDFKNGSFGTITFS